MSDASAVSRFGGRLAVAACLAILAGCSAEHGGGEAVETSRQALLTPQSADVLGFETLTGWSSTSASLALSPEHSQGKSSLQVTPTGWNEISSSRLGSLGVGPVQKLSFDIRPPSPPASPWWFGEVQLLIDAPSLGAWTRYIGRYDLAQAKAGEFNTVNFQIPSDLAQKLGGSYSDLVFRIVLNTPSGSKPYLLDNLRLNGAALPTKNGGIEQCPAFIRPLSNGDVRYELTTPSQRSLVELVVRKNGSDTTRDITSSGQQLEDGTFSYSLTDPKGAFAIGDAVSVRFRSRAGTSADIYSPGPDATKLSGALAYDPSYICEPLVDSDGDGKPDKQDGCPRDAGKDAGGVCGCGKLEVDSDQDKTPDCKDRCPNDPDHTVPGDCGCAGAYAPAGTACTDGPCVGRFTCNGAGQCGSALACAIPGTVGLAKEYRVDDRIYLLVPNNTTSWSEVGKLAPPGYSRLELDSAQENAVLAGQILKHYGPNDCVWTAGTVTAPGVISSVPRPGLTPTSIWDEHTVTRNVGNAFTSFASSQPPPGVSSGCVSMRGDGSWRVEDCNKSCFMVYERSAHSLVAKANPANFTVSCADFPGTVCDPRDGYDKAAEADCVSPGTALPGDPKAPGNADANALATSIEECNKCLGGPGGSPEACSSVCQGVASKPNGGRSCQNDAAAQVCQVTPTASSKLCSLHSECGKGELCGIYSYLLGVDALAPASPWLQAECKPGKDAAGKPLRCTTVRMCGTPKDGCDTDLPAASTEPGCSGPDCTCGETKVCNAVVPPVGNSDPLAPGEKSELGNLNSTEFKPESVFHTVPEPEPQIKDEPPSVDKGVHSWCQFAPEPQSQTAKDDKDGQSGSGSALKLEFHPDLDLQYNLKPLAQGDLDFDLHAIVSFKAQADFHMDDITTKIDIIDAQIGAIAERCHLETLAKLDVFGLDFVPVIEKKLNIGPLSRRIPQDPSKCDQAVDAFREVASRAKKAMHDAQELLEQYHKGLKGACLNPIALCDDLMKKAPAGFPKLKCDANISVENVVNTFIWNYERQIDSKLPLPESLKGLSFDIVNPKVADARLPNPRFPKVGVPNVPTAPELALPALPSLNDAQSVLNDKTTKGPLNFKGPGCASDKIQTERRTLLTVNFFLGPIPMLLQVEGVLKYGIDYGIDFDFQSQNLMTSSKSKAPVASVNAFAEPCVGAGVAMFVGAGFSYFGVRVSAGVEGMVNLATLSMPAHAGASIEAAREQVKVIDPLVQKFVAEVSTDPDVPRAARFVSKELSGLWDGSTFPLYRQKFYLGYDYGVRIVAADVLTGKLSATATAKFWLYKKKWRTTIVNFGNAGHPFERSLLHGHDELDVATGPFPWVTLDMPEAFVRLRQLKFTPNEFAGWKFGELIPSLRSNGGSDFSMPDLHLPDLSRLGFSLKDLSAISLPDADLRGIAELLHISFDDLKGRLKLAGANLGDLRLSDLSRLGFSFIDLADWPISDAYLVALDVDMSDMIKLGFDLSRLSLSKLKLSQKLNWPGCGTKVDLQRVGDFFYDNYCKKATQPPVIDELFSVPNVRPNVTKQGDTMLIPVEHELPGRVDTKELVVLLESGEFDDLGYVVPKTGADIAVSEQSKSCGGLNRVLVTDVSPYITTSYDAGTNKTKVAFTLRATDVCGGFMGIHDLKVRYTTDPAARL